ncbi:variable surface lipoprotein [Mycoplasmopsis bovis]|nr:variable surface lipoprotein [Mycoplasmopsis bovis]
MNEKINKIIISLSSIISISSMPLIAASCENKNPTDESIINNIAPPTQIILNLNKISKLKKEQRRWPNGSD